jgi:hypothetical protein
MPEAKRTAEEPQAGGRIVPAPENPKHRATYARDKKNPGQYLIRISGPYPERFEDKIVPVFSMQDKAYHAEQLRRAVWKGTENTAEYGGTVGEPVCLYHFDSAPKTVADDLPF